MKCFKDNATKKKKAKRKKKKVGKMYATWFLCKQWGLLIMHALISPQELIRALSAAERGPNHPVERDRDRHSERERERDQPSISTSWESTMRHTESVSLCLCGTHTKLTQSFVRSRFSEMINVCCSLKPAGDNLPISKHRIRLGKIKSTI